MKQPEGWVCGVQTLRHLTHIDPIDRDNRQWDNEVEVEEEKKPKPSEIIQIAGGTAAQPDHVDPDKDRIRLGVPSTPAEVERHAAFVEAEEFMEYHREHPDIYQALLKVAERAHERGYSKWGISGAFEVVRWEWRPDPNPERDGGFKLPNNWKPWYARLLMHEHIALLGLFDVRSCPADYLVQYLDTLPPPSPRLAL